MRTAGAGRDADGIVDDEPLPIGRSRSRRVLRRTFDALEQLPRGIGSVGAVAFIGATIAYGIAEGGHAPAVLDAVTARSGFTIDQVRISGHRETSDSAVLGALSIEPGSSLIAYDVAVARERILDLPWVETATVQKLYPDALDIVVTERPPFARWWNGERMFLIARDGTVITDEFEAVDAYPTLPLVAGVGAPAGAEAVLAMVDRYPGLAPRVKSVARIGERRWNIELEGGLTILLPEVEPEAALAELIQLDTTDGILNRDLVAIDLRLSDRLTVRLSPEAAEARRKELAKKPTTRKGAAT